MVVISDCSYQPSVDTSKGLRDTSQPRESYAVSGQAAFCKNELTSQQQQQNSRYGGRGGDAVVDDDRLFRGLQLHSLDVRAAQVVSPIRATDTVIEMFKWMPATARKMQSALNLLGLQACVFEQQNDVLTLVV